MVWLFWFTEKLDQEIESGTFLIIERKWEEYDKVIIDFPMDFRFIEDRKRNAGRVALSIKAWLKTDCQQAKSIWWFSDMKGIGFMVVCESEDP